MSSVIWLIFLILHLLEFWLCEICICCDCLIELKRLFIFGLCLVCRKCLYDKITKEELDCCPECNVDLGPDPFENIRSVLSNKFLTFYSSKRNERKKKPSLLSWHGCMLLLNMHINVTWNVMPTTRVAKPIIVSN